MASIKCFAVDTSHRLEDLGEIHRPSALFNIATQESLGILYMNGQGLITGNFIVKQPKISSEPIKLSFDSETGFILPSIQDAYAILQENIELIEEVENTMERLDPKAIETSVSRIYYSLQSAYSCLYNAGNAHSDHVEDNPDDAFFLCKGVTDEHLVVGSIVDHKISIVTYRLAQSISQVISTSNLSVPSLGIPQLLKSESKPKFKKMYFFFDTRTVKNSQYDVLDKLEVDQ